MAREQVPLFWPFATMGGDGFGSSSATIFVMMCSARGRASRVRIRSASVGRLLYRVSAGCAYAHQS